MVVAMFPSTWDCMGDVMARVIFLTHSLPKYPHNCVFVPLRYTYSTLLKMFFYIWSHYPEYKIPPTLFFSWSNKRIHNIFCVWKWHFNIIWFFINLLHFMDVEFEALRTPQIDINFKINHKKIHSHKILNLYPMKLSIWLIGMWYPTLWDAILFLCKR